MLAIFALSSLRFVGCVVDLYRLSAGYPCGSLQLCGSAAEAL